MITPFTFCFVSQANQQGRIHKKNTRHQRVLSFIQLFDGTLSETVLNRITNEIKSPVSMGMGRRLHFSHLYYHSMSLVNCQLSFFTLGQKMGQPIIFMFFSRQGAKSFILSSRTIIKDTALRSSWKDENPPAIFPDAFPLRALRPCEMILFSLAKHKKNLVHYLCNISYQ